jgi:hypothetical protein
VKKTIDALYRAIISSLAHKVGFLHKAGYMRIKDIQAPLTLHYLAHIPWQPLAVHFILPPPSIVRLVGST